MKDKLYWIWLNQIPELGARRVKKLLDYFKDAKGIWEAGREEINKVKGFGVKLTERIETSKIKFSFEKELKKLRNLNVKVVTLADKCYPKLLKEIYDPPPILYYRGELAKLKLPCISIVGARKCTPYGKKVAKKLAERLAELGIPVISGMARGIDSAAHRGALRSGVTYAILGSGIDVVYPPENKELMDEISRSGGVLTPFSLGTKPEAGNFPARNRIISGLTLGTVVVEAAEKSGSLITANLALEQGREVFAIPGNITREQSIGTNKLIKNGAKLVQRLDDILNELPLNSIIAKLNLENKSITKESRNNKGNSTSLSAEAKKVYELLSVTPKKFEALLAALELSSSRLNSILLELEVRGLIKQLPGRKFKLKN